MNIFFLNFLEIRMESDLNNTLNNLNENELEHLLNIIYKFIPFSNNVYRRLCLNIYLLDCRSIYRGWRHTKGLPVRGQRTWSNAWSVYKSNIIMRNFKSKNAKRFYLNAPVKESNIAYTAEYVNNLWKVQWPLEWYCAKVSLDNFTGHPSTLRIDLYIMSKYQVMHPLKLKNMSKKQKQSYRKNYFSLGFEPGFTKPLINAMFNKSMRGENNPSKYSNSKIILRDERLNKKKKH